MIELLEVLEFVLSGPWTFCGCFALASLIVAGAVLVVAGLANWRPLMGLVQVDAHRYTHHFSPTDIDHTDKRRDSHAVTGLLAANAKGEGGGGDVDASDTSTESVACHHEQPPPYIFTLDTGPSEL